MKSKVEDSGRMGGRVEGHIGNAFAISITITEASEVADSKKR
jgi:hypothetical protein